jgi:hypothetical protein
MASSENYWLNDCTRMCETDKAVLVELLEEERIWIPLSQVTEMHFDARGKGKMLISAWIAKQKGLI